MSKWVRASNWSAMVFSPWEFFKSTRILLIRSNRMSNRICNVFSDCTSGVSYRISDKSLRIFNACLSQFLIYTLKWSNFFISMWFISLQVYFLWICPSHKHFEWFIDVLRDVEKKDVTNVLEIHIFITQFFHKFDLRTTMLVRIIILLNNWI